MALLQRALGPNPEGRVIPARFYEWLQVAPPPAEGSYFIRYSDWIKPQNTARIREQKEPLETALEPKLSKEPWRGEDHPLVLQWLTINEQPLDRFLEASKKKQFFHPIVNSRKGEPQGGLLETLIPALAMVRDFSDALICRAMMRVKLGKFEDARQDLRACHRMARLMRSKVATLVQHSLGMNLERAALAADLVVLERADFSLLALQSWQKEGMGQPPLQPAVDSFDQIERLIPLQLVTYVNQFGLDTLAKSIKSTKIDDFGSYREFSSKYYPVYFDKVLFTINRGLDRLVATGRMSNLGEKYEAFLAIERELEAAKEHSQLLLQQIRVAVMPRFAQREVLGEMMGQFFLRHMAPSLRHVQQSEDETEEADRLFAIALSLAIHRKTKGAYPAQLSELAPALSQRVLEDLFSGKSHLYRKTADGYLLYSVGPNGEDDGGSSWEDRRGGDDFKIRLPVAANP